MNDVPNVKVDIRFLARMCIDFLPHVRRIVIYVYLVIYTKFLSANYTCGFDIFQAIHVTRVCALVAS